jgi:hypothetical protein
VEPFQASALGPLHAAVPSSSPREAPATEHSRRLIVVGKRSWSFGSASREQEPAAPQRESQQAFLEARVEAFDYLGVIRIVRQPKRSLQRTHDGGQGPPSGHGRPVRRIALGPPVDASGCSRRWAAGRGQRDVGCFRRARTRMGAAGSDRGELVQSSSLLRRPVARCLVSLRLPDLTCVPDARAAISSRLRPPCRRSLRSGRRTML